MTIYISFNEKNHQETKEQVKQNYAILAQRLAELGFETENAVKMFNEGRAILGSIVDGDVKYIDDSVIYHKKLSSYDTGFIGYNFTKWHRSLLSIKTVLDYFEPLVVQKNEDLLTLLYRLEGPTSGSHGYTRDTLPISQDLDVPQIVINGILKEYKPHQTTTILGTIYERWNENRDWPVYIPGNVKIIGGLKEEQDQGSFTQDIFYHPFQTNCDVKMVGMHPFVEIVGDKAFEHCDQLRTVVTSRNLKTIGLNAFLGCHQLQYVFLHPQLEQIGDHAFHDCPKLKKIYFQGNKEAFEQWKTKFNFKTIFESNLLVRLIDGSVTSIRLEEPSSTLADHKKLISMVKRFVKSKGAK
jgi:hypothetical protein